MQIHSIKASNFTPVHKRLEVLFPPNGIVVITGHNGSGKTALIEAIAWCLYGKTTRGTDPSRPDGTSVTVSATVSGTELTVCRERARGKKMTVAVNGTVHDTAQKAQEELDAILPSFEMWLRSSVLMANDASKFTAATDSERKRTFESVLGLGVFDSALVQCRQDAAAALRKAQAAAQEAATAASRHDEAERSLSAAIAQRDRAAQDHADRIEQAKGTYLKAKASYAALLETAPEYSYDELVQQQSELQDEITALEHKIKKAENALVEFDSEAKYAAKKLRDIEQAQQRFSDGSCPTCGREMDDEWHMSAAQELSSAQVAATSAANELAEKRQHIIDRTEAARKLIGDKRTKLREIRVALDEVRTHEKKLDSAKALRDAVKNSYTTLRDQPPQFDNVAKISERCNTLEIARKKAAKISADENKVAATLASVEKVLNTKGVRARLVDDAVSAMGATADRWLRTISDDALSLSMQVVDDAISLVIAGSGDDCAYKSCSTGQQRRVDTAIMFALSEVVAGATRQPNGTMFADEVFDGLDAAGSTAVIEALEELSSDRTVLVITHKQDLADRIPATKRIHFGVNNG